MVTYNCKRCGYTTNLRGNIKRHFLKKKTCRAVAEPCDIKTCFEEQLGEKYPLTLNYAEKTNEMNEFTYKLLRINLIIQEILLLKHHLNI